MNKIFKVKWLVIAMLLVCLGIGMVVNLRTRHGVVKDINDVPFKVALMGLNLVPIGDISFYQRSPAWRSSVILWFKTDQVNLPKNNLGFDTSWSVFEFRNTRAGSEIPEDIDIPGIDEASTILQIGGVRKLVIEGSPRAFGLSFGFVKSVNLLFITIDPL
jgi:hypothetical protein